MVDEEYLATSSPTIQDKLYNNLYNMSLLLQDVSGQIHERERKLLLRGFGNYVSPIGDLILSESQIIGTDNQLLGREMFNPSLTSYAFELLSSIKETMSDLIYKPMYPTEEESSPILRYNSKLPTLSQVFMSYLYLELFALYKALMSFNDNTHAMKMDFEDIQRLLDNSKFIHAEIGKLGNKEEVYLTLNVVKHVQRAILFVRGNITSILGW